MAADYEHRLSSRWSAFGRGWLGATYGYPTGASSDYGVLGGVRFRF